MLATGVKHSAFGRLSLFASGLVALVCSLLLLRPTLALEVAPDSDCALLCMDRLSGGNASSSRASSTQTSDVLCFDDQYQSTSKGRKFVECVRCEQNSTASSVNPPESDIQWFIFNLRLSLAWCVLGFGSNNKFSTECYDICLPTKPAVVDMILETYDGKPYDYCSSTDSAFMKNYKPCADCLANSRYQTIQANFVRAMSEACVQKPGPPQTVQLSTDIFSAKPRTASTATLSEITASSSPISSLTADASTTSTALASVSTSPSLPTATNLSSNPLAVGQVVGIGVGSGVATIGAILVLWTLYRHCRQRQLRRQEPDKQTREGYDATAQWPYPGYANSYGVFQRQEMPDVSTAPPLPKISPSAQNGLDRGQKYEPPRTPMVEAAANVHDNAGANIGRRGPSSLPQLTT